MEGMRPRHLLLAGVLIAAIAPLPAAAYVETKPIQFAPGASSGTFEGSLGGGKILDYKLRAKAGQTMSVTLKSNNQGNYFNVLPPGSKGVALFVGSTSGNEWSGTLANDGEYTIRLYLVSSAVRRDERADYKLTVAITGAASTPP